MWKRAPVLYMAILFGYYSHYMVIIWRLYGDYMAIALLEICLVTFRMPVDV